VRTNYKFISDLQVDIRDSKVGDIILVEALELGVAFGAFLLKEVS
jgi:hypothetical protein